MTPENPFYDYYNSLKKMQQNRFLKVLDLYKKLQPRYYIDATLAITNRKKLSDTVRQEMQKYNNVIYNMLFEKLGFIKESHGFKIGDTFYTKNKPHMIMEFQERHDGIFVISEDCNKTLATPIMIEQITPQPRPIEPESYFHQLSKKDNMFDDFSITDITSDIDMFLYHYGNNEYNFNPEYQRDLVWSTEQKQAFMKALMIGNVELTPTFIAIPYKNASAGQPHSEVLDGKQRLNAVLDYVRGKFDIDGYYFKDLNYNDLQRFYNTKMVYRNIKYYDKQKGWSLMTTQQKVELFLQINEYGQHVSEEHLSKIKEEYLKEN